MKNLPTVEEIEIYLQAAFELTPLDNVTGAPGLIAKAAFDLFAAHPSAEWTYDIWTHVVHEMYRAGAIAWCAEQAYWEKPRAEREAFKTAILGG